MMKSKCMMSSYDFWKAECLKSARGCDMYRCTICGTGAFHINGSDTHFLGARHRESLEAEFRRMDRILVDKRDAYSRISRLCLASWRDQVQQPIMKILCVDSNLAFRDFWPYSREDDRVALPASAAENLEANLEKFEKMEVASQLELVAWKLNCLHLDGSGNFYTMQGILDQWAIDENFDPVEYKRQRRLSSNVGVIVERVLELLW